MNIFVELQGVSILSKQIKIEPFPHLKIEPKTLTVYGNNIDNQCVRLIMQQKCLQIYYICKNSIVLTITMTY